LTGAPPVTPVAIERRTRRGKWIEVGAAVADAAGDAVLQLRTPKSTRRWGLRARAADGVLSPAAHTDIRPVTLMSVGDINLGDGPGAVMAERGSRWPWVDVAPALRAADIAFGNLECSVSNRGAPVPKQYTFRGRPRLLRTLRQFAGFDVVNLANNHVGDYGPLATADTIRHVRQAGLVGVGAGFNATGARRPRVVERLGLRVVFVGFSDIGPYTFAAGRRTPGTRLASPENVRADIRAARRRGDVVVATFHWGVERDARPSARQVTLGRAALSAGADVVIGAHPHVLQPIVRPSRHRVIAYSLGNFVWSAGSAPTASTGMLKVSLSTRGVEGVVFTPARIVATRPRPRG
jgi:poly-gamma-glutamate synthesis protein (capsule biosynthesis protein)